MNTKLVAALACSAALALGACSGGGAPAAPTTPTTPGPTDPGSDTRTAAQRTFDTALAAAEKSLADARRMVTAAVAAAAAADTDQKRVAAQEDIDEARTALINALAAARALSAPADDFDRLGLAAIQVDKATAAQTEDDGKLRRAEGDTGWTGTFLRSRAIPRTTVDVTRTERRNTAGTADVAGRLKADDLPPVMYADGKIVMSGDQGSSGDRLRMRGFPSRQTGGGNGALANTASTPVAISSATDAYFDQLLAGLTITPSGLVIDMGGVGSDLGTEFRIDVDDKIDATTDNAYDLNLNFGRPSASPTGNAEYYWSAALMPTTKQATDETFLKEGTQTLPIGVYYVQLSNHIGVDTNLEDADDPVASARDDTNSYLSYAAYGHLDFIPRTTSPTVPVTDNSDRARVFPFAVGYDAFKDATGMKVTDVAEADKITAGKFKGRTIAAEIGHDNQDDLWPRNRVGGPTTNPHSQLRGDIELTATISPTHASNKITGKIMDLESWDDVNGYWKDYTHLTGDVALAEGQIGVDGSFSGVVTDPDDTGNDWNSGYYKGNFYGPLSGLEAAGTWYVQVNWAGTRDVSILGSFGAARVYDYGKANERYGRVVQSGGGGS